MKDQTRDKLLIALAIMIHDMVDDSPSALCSRCTDKENLWRAITKATAEHHKRARETEQ